MLCAPPGCNLPEAGFRGYRLDAVDLPGGDLEILSQLESEYASFDKAWGTLTLSERDTVYYDEASGQFQTFQRREWERSQATVGLGMAAFNLAAARAGVPRRSSPSSQAVGRRVPKPSGRVPWAPRVGIRTDRGPAVQSILPAAMKARGPVSRGAPVYRLGTRGKSHAAEAQFWTMEHPDTPGFAARYGIPPENVKNANFIEVGVVRPGTPFITRPAPPAGTNPGGGIEVVVPPGGVEVTSLCPKLKENEL